LTKFQRRHKTQRKNLGARLQGVDLQPAPFVAKVQQDTPCTPLCQVSISTKKIRWMRKLVERQYRIHVTFDQLPVLMRSSELNYAVRGYPVGFKAPPTYTGLKHDEYYLYNHLKFTINYQDTSSSDTGGGGGVHITGFDVHPVSITLEPDTDQCVKSSLKSSNSDIVNDPDTYLPLRVGNDKDLQVVYSYEVEWVRSELPWADRWDVYLIGSPDEVEFVPGEYEDDDMHNLMLDKGFEKLSVAEIELQNKEKSQLLSTGGANTQKEKGVQRLETLKDHAEKQERQNKEKSQLLSTGAANTQKEKAPQRREALKGRAAEQDRIRKAEGEKLSAAEIEVQNKEKSQLLSTGSANTQKEKAVQRRETLKGRAEEQDRLRKAAIEARKEERKRKKEEREILGIDGLPSYMVQLYVGVFGVLLVVVYGGMRRERQQRRKPAASRVRLSS
jgi:hypothetical protein